MNLVNAVTILLIGVYIPNVLAINRFRNRYRFLKKDLNITTARTKVEERYIEQPLDHFNENERRTWKMRYFEGLELWKQGGPIYLYVGGEGPVGAYDVQVGILFELAQETHGALYASEHRYYGKSIPFPDLNATTLAYLSSRQALADIALLLKTIKSSPQRHKSKVVVVGGSYAGNLAAWMRLLYPDLVDAAIASSAPVLAKADFYQYLEVVGNDFKQYGTPECYDKIVKKFKRYDQLFQSSAGIKQLKKEEQICNETDMSQAMNRAVFFDAKENSYSSRAQYGTPQEILRYCQTPDDEDYEERKNLSADPFEFGLTFWAEELDCYTYSFKGLIDALKRDKSSMAWVYQTCTEFGYFQSTTSENQIFTKNIPMEYFYEQCSELFGSEFNKLRVDESVKKTNNMYGGLRPNVTQVVFVNGDIDPWHRLGISKSLSEDTPAKLIHGTSHCMDLQSDESGDPAELIETRKYVKKLIKKWIAADVQCIKPTL